MPRLPLPLWRASRWRSTLFLPAQCRVLPPPFLVHIWGAHRFARPAYQMIAVPLNSWFHFAGKG